MSPIATNSSSKFLPGNTRTRGYLDSIAQERNLATPPRVTIPQTGSGITEFLMSPGSAVTEGSARACTAGSGSDSGNQDIHTSQKTPVRQSSTSPKTFLRRARLEDPTVSGPACRSGTGSDEQSEQKSTTTGIPVGNLKFTSTPILAQTTASGQCESTTPRNQTVGREHELTQTPSTPEEQRVLDDDDVPATREEFRKMRRQLREMKRFMHEVTMQHADDIDVMRRDLEEARTWATAARIASDRLKKEENKPDESFKHTGKKHLKIS